MPVKSESLFDLDVYLSQADMQMRPHVDELAPTEPLLPDDIWKKFELDFPTLCGELSPLDDIFGDIMEYVQEDAGGIQSSMEDGELCEIRNHDCMWAGHCASKEHPADELRASIKSNRWVHAQLPHCPRGFVHFTPSTAVEIGWRPNTSEVVAHIAQK